MRMAGIIMSDRVKKKLGPGGTRKEKLSDLQNMFKNKCQTVDRNYSLLLFYTNSFTYWIVYYWKADFPKTLHYITYVQYKHFLKMIYNEARWKVSWESSDSFDLIFIRHFHRMNWFHGVAFLFTVRVCPHKFTHWLMDLKATFTYL